MTDFIVMETQLSDGNSLTDSRSPDPIKSSGLTKVTPCRRHIQSVGEQNATPLPHSIRL